MKAYTLVILAPVSFLVLACQRPDPMAQPADTPKIPMANKFNFRTGQQHGAKFEVWTESKHGLPIKPGVRVYLSTEAHKDTPPEIAVRLVLTNTEAATDIREVTVHPKLKKTMIDGGYWENVRVDETTFVERKEKFTGQAGVWEVSLDDPLNTDYRNPKSKLPTPGRYKLSITLSIKGQGQCAFDDLPLQFFKHRGDPG